MIRRKKDDKPEESKTVRQWALLGRTPMDGAAPSYIWDTQAGPHTIYFHEKDTREMSAAEISAFRADMKGYSQKYIRMLSEK